MLTVTRRLFQCVQIYQKNSSRRVYVDLKETLKSALSNYAELKLTPLRISNCKLGSSFSKTFLDYEVFTNPDGGALYHVKFSSVFKKGFDCLNKYTESNVGFFDTFRLNGVPDDERDHFRALAALRMFLYEMEFHEKCLKNPKRNAFDGKKKGEIAALLNNHLLSRLVYGNKYLISNNYQNQPSQCPCLNPNLCMEYISYGHTGLGYEELWYGHPDIVLMPDELPDYIPISFFEEFPNDELDDENTGQERDGLQRNEKSTEKCEIKSKNTHFDKWAEQILSQAITFAFYQGNVVNSNGISPVSALIPSLVLTPAHYYIVMYDYVNDILLSSSLQRCSLWDESYMKLNLSAVLQMWMVLNHLDFVPALSPKEEHVLEGSCNFHNILQNMHLFEKTKNISHKSTFKSPCKCGKLIKQLSIDLDEC
ncbi:uncharacterized protein LOC133180211 [Saccostrea echinata]|uniref:uncharacterized protein LOC133180211 n=1 Tax=Saccostrea echinata TaxID=191078 RepID=UPI002A83612A|nr:uncharacterized protein LOC133180211 [Saccostrea echinata]